MIGSEVLEDSLRTSLVSASTCRRMVQEPRLTSVLFSWTRLSPSSVRKDKLKRQFPNMLADK
jgi:hypothetical protein